MPDARCQYDTVTTMINNPGRYGSPPSYEQPLHLPTYVSMHSQLIQVLTHGRRVAPSNRISMLRYKSVIDTTKTVRTRALLAALRKWEQEFGVSSHLMLRIDS